MGDRSTTHTLSNHTVFASGKLRDELLDLIDPTHPPPGDLLPTFLHEATHHWCFTSTVGTAIAVLGMRGRISAFRAIEAETPEETKIWEERAADDLTRAEVASLLLQPLAEGMASFAEFDLSVSNRSPVLPPPLRWAAMFSGRSDLQGSPGTRVRRRLRVAQQTAIALIVARKSQRSLRAKEALLVEPMSCEASDGYLMGYLFIKTLWRYFQANHDRFHEPELFLLKVYDIFYEDMEFVRLLFDSSQKIPAALGPITQRLCERLNFALGDAKNSLDEFFASLVSTRSRHYDNGGADGHILPLAEPMDADPSARFQAMWGKVVGPPIHMLLNEGDTLSPSQEAMLAMDMVGHGRHLLELGSLGAVLHVGMTETAVEIDGKLVARLATLLNDATGKHDGALHILLNTRSGAHIVAAVSSQSRLIAFRQTPEAAGPEDARRVMGRIVGVNLFHQTLAQRQDELSRLREISRLPGYLQQVRSRLNGIYAPLACTYVPDFRLEDLVPKMMASGIYGAFDYDGDAIRALAILGSMANLHQSPTFIRSEFAERGIDYDAVLERLRGYSRSTNLFRLHEGSWLRSSL